MNADLRHHLRTQIDAIKRERIAAARAHGETICTGCGTDLDQQTRGCKTCHDRKRRKARRANPVYVAAETAKQRAKRHAARMSRETAATIKG